MRRTGEQYGMVNIIQHKLEHVSSLTSFSVSVSRDRNWVNLLKLLFEWIFKSHLIAGPNVIVMKHQEGAAQPGVTLQASLCQRQSDSIEMRSVVFIVTSVITHKAQGHLHISKLLHSCVFSYSMTPLAVITEQQRVIKAIWLIIELDKSIHQLHKYKANFADYFPTFYFNYGIPNMSFLITVFLSTNLKTSTFLLAFHYENVFFRLIQH